MSDTEEDSQSSADSWPVNEDWLLGIIKKYHNSAAKIKVTVRKSNNLPNESPANLLLLLPL